MKRDNMRKVNYPADNRESNRRNAYPAKSNATLRPESARARAAGLGRLRRRFVHFGLAAMASRGHGNKTETAPISQAAETTGGASATAAEPSEHHDPAN
jgi:hypothetical protein